MGSKIDKDFLEKIVKESSTTKECLQKLNMTSYKAFGRLVSEYGISTEHFTPYKGNGVKHEQMYIPLNDYLKLLNPKGSKILKKLVLEGIKEYRCEKCGINEWNGEKIVLQLHHIDGNHYNNDVSNLQILCPNCHSQTHNFCGGKRKKEVFCKNCGEKITRFSGSGLCKKCSRKDKRVTERPTKEELIELLKNNGFCGVGKMFSVSDNAVRKWCDAYDIPRSIKFYKK